MQVSLQKQIAAMSQSLADLRAEVEEKKENKPVEEEAPVDEPKAPETEDKPVEEGAPEAPAEETNSEDVAPVEEAPADDVSEDDKEDDEVPPGVAQKALRKRINTMQRKLASMERQLTMISSDPSFAAASMQASDIPCADAAEGGSKMTREQANAAYAKLTSAREKAEFRKAHAKELGL